MINHFQAIEANTKDWMQPGRRPEACPSAELITLSSSSKLKDPQYSTKIASRCIAASFLSGDSTHSLQIRGEALYRRPRQYPNLLQKVRRLPRFTRLLLMKTGTIRSSGSHSTNETFRGFTWMRRMANFLRRKMLPACLKRTRSVCYTTSTRKINKSAKTSQTFGPNYDTKKGLKTV
jgi:hypothetical protein